MTPVGVEPPATADTNVGTGASNQGPGIIQPGGGGLRGVGGLGGLGRPGALAEPRYKVEAISFHCYDETGYDALGSDEIMVGIYYITYVNNPHNLGDFVFIGPFEDVDAGETRTFQSNQRCILPINSPNNEFRTQRGDVWTCSDKGVPGPFYFMVEMREIDFPESESDRIGLHEFRFTPEELAAAMPKVSDTYEETIDLGPCYSPQGCVESPGLPTGPHYSFTYRITRLPDQVLEPQVSPGP